MFSVGEYIIYGVEGVCMVEEAGRLKVSGLNKNRDYYRLRPYYHGGTIYTPVDGKAAMRPVLTRAELDGLLPRLRQMEPLEDIPADSRAAGEYYRRILAEHDCVKLPAVQDAPRPAEAAGREPPDRQLDRASQLEAGGGDALRRIWLRPRHCPGTGEGISAEDIGGLSIYTK